MVGKRFVDLRCHGIGRDGHPFQLYAQLAQFGRQPALGGHLGGRAGKHGLAGRRRAGHDVDAHGGRQRLGGSRNRGRQQAGRQGGSEYFAPAQT
ncbi:hypothetical protein D3C72_2222500 [compost metagenome]